MYRTFQQSPPKSRMDVSGYQRRPWKVALCHACSVLTVGLPLILFHWKPHLEVQAKCRRCPLRQADWVVIRDSFGQYFTARIQTEEMEESSLDYQRDDGRGSVAVGVTDDGEESWDTVGLHQKKEKSILRYYLFEGLRYVWIEKWQAFCKASMLNDHWACSDLHLACCGLSHEEQLARRKLYGPNLIDVPVKSYIQLLRDEILNPFYIFQIVSIILWLCEEYYSYASCILVISTFSIGISLYQTRKQAATLRNMVKMSLCVRICRAPGEEATVSSVDLVPGDCFIVPKDGMLVPCDAVLLTGECLVNESMLTGESVPLTKTPLPKGAQAAGAIYSPEEHKRHTLFCGTQVLQARSYTGPEVLAVVAQTGFCTVKGDLVSSMLFPKPVHFKFYKDAGKFVAFLAILAVLGTAYSIAILIKNKVPLGQIITRALDIVTVVVPPALPAAMTVGTIYAQRRLKRHGIFCISPPRINLSGKVHLVCFDKTGTLTEDGLDVWGVLPKEKNNFLPLVYEPDRLAAGPLLSCLATCHSVSLLGDQPVGDPVDLKMLESTGWTQEAIEGPEGEAGAVELFGTRALALLKPPERPQEPHTTAQTGAPRAILRRFSFSSSLRRMSVLVKAPGDGLAEAYMKGAPEMVASLCKRESVPADFSQRLHRFTSDGFRVLGLAYKTVASARTFEDAQEVTRESVECEMAFLGLLVMKNVLKPETAPVIHLLRNAEIRMVMVTGDNMLTAVNVAKSSRMVEAKEQVAFVSATPPGHGKPAALRFIPSEHPPELPEASYQLESGVPKQSRCHLALNGKSFAVVCEHFPELLPKILVRATIFARMLPDQKTLLIQKLQGLSYCVAMCGDGANDCGALKAADVGISLSEAEASVASPFTSRLANIECVPVIVRYTSSGTVFCGSSLGFKQTSLFPQEMGRRGSLALLGERLSSREGRCSLVTSFGVFKYMALYSLVQFVSVLLLYTINTNLGDLQFLFFDLIITTTVAALMGKTAPAKHLGPQRPQGALLSVVVLGSLLLQTALIIAVQVISYFITVSQAWFIPLNSTVTAPHNLPNYENTVLFCISGFQYLTLAVAMSKGHPFRKPLYTNVVFLVALIVLFGLMVWLTLYPLSFMKSWLQLKGIGDLDFKVILLGVATLHFFFAFVLETGLDHGLLSSLRALRRKKSAKKLFKRLEKELSLQQPAWPPFNETLLANNKISMASR